MPASRAYALFIILCNLGSLWYLIKYQYFTFLWKSLLCSNRIISNTILFSSKLLKIKHRILSFLAKHIAILLTGLVWVSMPSFSNHPSTAIELCTCFPSMRRELLLIFEHPGLKCFLLGKYTWLPTTELLLNACSFIFPQCFFLKQVLIQLLM